MEKHKTIGRHLTEEEVNKEFTECAWHFLGEDDELILIKCEESLLPCDRTQLIYNYLSAMEEHDGDYGWYEDVLATIIEDDPEEVQLMWDMCEGDISWRLVRKTDDEFDHSKYKFWAFILEADI